MKHNYSAYGNNKCRCDICTEDQRRRHLEYMHSHPEQQAKHRRYMREYRGGNPSKKCPVCHEMFHQLGFHLKSMHGLLAEHGTTARYKQGCTCDECRGAEAAYKRYRRTLGKPN